MVAVMSRALWCALFSILLRPSRALDADNRYIIDKGIPGLLRLNRHAQPVSSNLASYADWDCTGLGSERRCTLKSPSTQDMRDEMAGGGGGGGVEEYIHGVVVYVALGLLSAALLVIGGLLYHIYSDIYFGCWCAGMCEPTPTAAAPKAQSEHISPDRRLAISLSLMCLLCALLVTLIILAAVLGVREIFSSVGEVADAPLGLARIAYEFSGVVEKAFITLSATVLLPTLRVSNSTFSSTIDWASVNTDLRAINSSIQELPNIKQLRQSVYSISLDAGNLTQTLDLILDSSAALEAAKGDVIASAYVLLGDLQDTEAAVAALRATTSGGQSAVDQAGFIFMGFFGAGGAGNWSFSDTDGLVDWLQHDVALAQRNSTPGYGLPLSSTFQQASTGPSASTLRLLSGAYDSANLAELQTLNSRLHSIYYAITLLPNFTLTAQNLVALNDTIHSMLATGGVWDDFDAFFEHFDADYAALPDTALLTTHLDTLFAAVDRLDTATARAEVASLTPYLNSLLGSLLDLSQEVGKIRSAVELLLNPLYSLMVQQPRRFNESIYRLPFDLGDMYGDVNRTVREALVEVGVAVVRMEDAADSVENEIDVIHYLDIIDTVQGNVDDSITFNRTLYYALAGDINNINATFNSPLYKLSTASTRLSLLSALVSPSLVEALSSLGGVTAPLEGYLQRLVGAVGDITSSGERVAATGEYLLLARGVCSADTTVYCDSDGDCPTTCGSAGAYRCSANGDPSQAVTPCTHDADCAALGGPSTSYCLADTTRAYRLHTSLIGLGNATLPSANQTAAAVGGFDSLRGETASLDLARLGEDLDQLQTSLVGDVSDEIAELQDVIDSLEDPDNSYDLSSITGEVATGRVTIASVDYVALDETLEKVQAIQEQGQKYVTDGISTMESVEDFVYQKSGLSDNFRRMGREALEGISNTKGFGPMVEEFAANLEDVTYAVRLILGNVTSADITFKRVELTDRVREEVAPYLDRATGNPFSGYVDVYAAGALYYMLQLSNASADRMVNVRDPTQNTISYNKDGDRYDDNRFCVTRYCFEQQQLEMEQGGDNDPLLLSPQAIVRLSLIPLIVVLVVAVVAMLCPLCPASSALKACPSRCLVWLILPLAPLYLLITSPLLGLLIVASDGCHSGTGILGTYVDAMGDGLCGQLGGNGSSNNCHLAGGPANLDLYLDLRSMLTAISEGECASVPGDNSNDPFYLALSSLGTQLSAQTVLKSATFIERDFMKDVRQPVRDVITTAARGAGFFVQELLTNLGDDVLSCENVGAVLSAFKSPVCYSTVGPLAWFVGMLYLAGFAMCCVGLPAACSMQRHYRLLGMENRVSVYDDEGGDEGMGEGGQGGGEGGTGGRDMLDEVAVLAALQKEIYGMSLQPASA